jgi:hypothetical protein
MTIGLLDGHVRGGPANRTPEQKENYYRMSQPTTPAVIIQLLAGSQLILDDGPLSSYTAHFTGEKNFNLLGTLDKIGRRRNRKRRIENRAEPYGEHGFRRC